MSALVPAEKGFIAWTRARCSATLAFSEMQLFLCPRELDVVVVDQRGNDGSPSPWPTFKASSVWFNRVRT